MTLEERFIQMEKEINDLRAEKEKTDRNKWWKEQHDHFRNELDADGARYAMVIRTGIDSLIRGTLDCKSMYALSSEGKRLAAAMMDELKAVILKYYQPQNNPEICHPGRSYERF